MGRNCLAKSRDTKAMLQCVRFLSVWPRLKTRVGHNCLAKSRKHKQRQWNELARAELTDPLLFFAGPKL